MLAENLGRALIGKCRLPTHAPRDFGQHPPIRPGFAGRRPEGALARNAPLGIGDRAVLLAPRRRRQDNIGKARRIGRPAIADDDKRAGAERRAHPLGARHADGRIGVENPQRLDLAVECRVEQVDRLEAGPRRHSRRIPEAAHAIDIRRIGEAHMRGELVGKAADLAAAHRVRLAGQ